MKNIDEYIYEGGFYKNIGSDINSTIEEWWGTKERPFPDWFPKVYVYPDTDERYYGLRYNFDEKCVYIYDCRHKTDRLSIKIDLVKEWENCFSHLYQDTKDLGVKDLQFYLWKEKRSAWHESELWISVRTGQKRPRYVYRLYKGHIPVFKKIDKDQVC